MQTSGIAFDSRRDARLLCSIVLGRVVSAGRSIGLGLVILVGVPLISGLLLLGLVAAVIAEFIAPTQDPRHGFH